MNITSERWRCNTDAVIIPYRILYEEKNDCFVDQPIMSFLPILLTYFPSLSLSLSLSLSCWFDEHDGTLEHKIQTSRQARDGMEWVLGSCAQYDKDFPIFHHHHLWEWLHFLLLLNSDGCICAQKLCETHWASVSCFGIDKNSLFGSSLIIISEMLKSVYCVTNLLCKWCGK